MMVKYIYTELNDFMAFTPLGDALNNKLSGKGPLKKQVEAAQAVEIAKKVFEELFPTIASHANPLFLKNRTLTVSCSSSAMAQEIRLNQSTIVDKINEKLGKQEVDRIRYLA